MCDAEILDELTTSRGELKVRNVSFSEDRHGLVRYLWTLSFQKNCVFRNVHIESMILKTFVHCVLAGLPRRYCATRAREIRWNAIDKENSDIKAIIESSFLRNAIVIEI